MKWEKKKIKNIGKIITGKTPPTSNRDFFDGEYLFVTPTDLDFNNYYIYKTKTTISEVGKSRHLNQFLPVNSVMYTCIGNTIGKIALNKNECLTNQQINSIIPNDKHNFKFIYYYLISITPYIKNLGGGVATPIVNKSKFEDIDINLPPLPTQRRIASILSAYDDLIENNLKRIKLLEEKAQLHYKELIQDSAKWDKIRLEEFVSVVKGRKPANVIEHPEEESQLYLLLDTVERGKILYTTDLSLPKSKITDVLMCMDGARSGLSYRGMVGAIGSTMAIWRSNSERVSGEYLYQFMKQNESAITQGNTGAAIPHANRKFILDMKMLIPPKKEAESFDSLTQPIINLINTLHNQNTKLREARDILLPRLMSGEIEV